MSKKTDDSNGLVILGFLMFLPFLIFAILHYSNIKRRYPQTDTSQRVFDIGNLVAPLLVGSIATFFGYATFISLLHVSSLHLSQTPIIGILGLLSLTVFSVLILLVCYKIAQSISSTYYGVIIDNDSDMLILPRDMANYSIEDFFRFRFIRELGHMESVPLSEIRRITRESGKSLYVHGAFGSRGIHFSCKQKRDECIFAIEQNASRARTTFEIE
ncbi:hypothetical protein U5801_00900 [Lamprobacter modestohalophilus]|uniref:hypothetical protein n=1 Tax=Lamprobacter modestohalophilus TaxID=1064514 RepID=UPI002ADEEF3E|nr:hypothetical protein [Lamprobacter modestohalophilus]MEA1048381.1 hypothetical protein [Lamprobacter modestohalophilus]